jgi:4a-hydroxytetrahydrobiopterin dehydratase
MSEPTPPAGRLDDAAIAAAGLDDWRKLGQAIHARFDVPSYARAAELVAAIAEAADAAGHEPDVHVAPGAVDVALCTRESGRWVTPADLELAARISDVARALGLTPRPAAVTQLELALDTADEAGVAPFWSALLTGSEDSRVFDSIFDATDRVPSVWFQPSDSRQADRQRWHFDVWVAPEALEERIAAAVAAGGTIVDDRPAPSFTVLADGDGNRVCLCTTTGR